MSTDTNVFVSIVRPPPQPGKDPHPVGELLVSVIDPTHDLIHIHCKKHDAKGVLKEVFDTLHRLPGRDQINIALAEGATVDHRGFYHASLVCELLDSHDLDEESNPNELLVTKRKSEIDARARKIREKLRSAGFEGWNSEDPEVTTQPAMRFLRWYEPAQIVHGLIQNTPWRKMVDEFVVKDGSADAYDFKRAVVTADTTQRVARFVFPKKGAVAISIKHVDTPGALAVLTKALASEPLDLNILSTLLRRGGNKDGKSAVLIAVCEPTNEVKTGESLINTLHELEVDIPEKMEEQIKKEFASLRRKIIKVIKNVPPRLSAKCRVDEGKDWQASMYVRHPQDIGVLVPEELQPLVDRIKRHEVRPGWTPVFLSRRFAGKTAHTDRILEHIRSALEKNKYEAIEAIPVPGTYVPAIHQVESRLWACKMGIVLVTELKETPAISMNLAHEYGFISGQGKPVIFLMERGLKESLTNTISNLSGIVVEEFDVGEGALIDTSPTSVYCAVVKWLKRVNPDDPMPFTSGEE